MSLGQYPTLSESELQIPRCTVHLVIKLLDYRTKHIYVGMLLQVGELSLEAILCSDVIRIDARDKIAFYLGEPSLKCPSEAPICWQGKDT